MVSNEYYMNPVILDSTVLSNYASSNSVDWLTSTYDGLMTVPVVQKEIYKGYKNGKDFLGTALDAMNSSEIHIAKNVGEMYDRSELRGEYSRTLDEGEAQALFCAGLQRVVAGEKIERILATDDLQARKEAKECDIPVTGSIGLLVRGIDDNQISVATADTWLDTWSNKRDFYSPIDEISEILPNKTEK